MRFIGCKAQLLEQIKDVVDTHAKDTKTFCDVFSGTSSVARYFKQWFEITSNDILFFSYCLQKATIENDTIPSFLGVKKIIGDISPICYLNQLDTKEMETLPCEKRFFQNNYSPKGKRMYVTDANALRIDYSRNIVEDWKNSNLITENEYYYLIACIVEGIPYVSNIAGTYGAFHKFWDKRSQKKFELISLPVQSNGKQNKCYNEDGVNLLKNISGDILYIDPPYNERQYLPNYHVLETAAKYDFPVLRGVTGQREQNAEKSAFCSKKTVVQEFDKLIQNANFKHIILSYNTDGIMNISDIQQVMTKYGKPETFEVKYIPYRRFKSRNSAKSNDLKEMLIYIEKEVE